MIKNKNEERRRLYWTMALKTFAISLVSVFVPAYLYKLGFSISEIMLYFLVRELCELFMVIPTSLFMKYLGVRKTFVSGCLLTLLNLYLLYLLPNDSSLILITAISEGLAISLFFLPYHFLFSASVAEKDSGKQISIMDVLINVVAALAPLAGGLIANEVGLQPVILLALLFLVFAFIPLLKGAKDHKLYNFSVVKPFKMITSRDSVSNMGLGVTEMVATIIWPLYIFLTFKNYATLGIIVSSSLLLVIILSIIIGMFADRGFVKKFIWLGSASSSVIHLARLFSPGIYYITFINLLTDISHTFFRIPWTREFYKHANKDRGTYIATMELAVCLGRTALWIALLLISYVSSNSRFMLLAFLMGSTASLLIPLITKKSRSA